MNGDELLAEIERRIKIKKGTKSVTDNVLARELGVTQPALQGYRGKELTPKQVANLLDKAAKKAAIDLADSSIVPVVEFLELDRCETRQGKSWQIFSTKTENGDQHPYWTGLRKELEATHGIYIFHDSRGRAIYAGKAHRLSLWTEVNNAFNRNRKEVQSIKRVSHPSTKTQFRSAAEIQRKIVREEVPLWDIACYLSAYSVPPTLIGKLEALIVRSFANDLLNVRMEAF
jgi:hypothetical protein